MRARRWTWSVAIGVSAAGCAIGVSSRSVSPTNVRAVRVGETMTQVRQALGPPQQEWPRLSRPDGTEQLVWEYATASMEERAVVGAIQPTTRNAVSFQRQYRREPMTASSYLVVFIDGRVSEIASP